MSQNSGFNQFVTRSANNLNQKIYIIYLVALSVSVFIISYLYVQTVQMIPASKNFKNLIPKFSYSFRLPQISIQTIYPDFRGYIVYSCPAMQIDFEHPVQSQVLLKYAPDNKHFHFQVTNGTILSLIFDRNGASDRQNVVVMKDQEFIGNTDNIICELISCNFVISSVLNAKHDVLLTVNSFQILTNNCNKIESTQVHHILNPERNYCSYFVNLHPQNYVVFNEIFEQSIWGMQKGNGFDIYRLVKNDDGLNFLTLSLCGLSIFLVIGGVGHALIKSIVDNVKVD